MADQGGRSKQLEDDSPGPWTDWTEHDRAERAIAFITTYCIPSKGHGAGEPLQLAPFQRAWLRESLADGVRSSVLLLPRGNGKSSLIGALAAWALFDGEPGQAPDIPVVASTVQQAKRTSYGALLSFVKNHPALRTRAKIYSATSDTRIYVPTTEGVAYPVSDYIDGLQGLDPTLAVADELAFLSIEAWDSLLLASGKRPRSLVVGIGSPGPSRDCALYHLRQASIEGEIPGFRYQEYAAPDGCDVHDEDAWRVANPALAEGFMAVDALRAAVAITPEPEFRIYRLGQWADGLESWLGPSGGPLWESLTRPRRKLLEGAPTWLGVDVGLKRDSTAVVAVQSFGDDFHAVARIWAPADDKPVDVSDVMHHIRELAGRYDVKAVSFDPRFFDYPATVLGDEGLPMVEIPQSIERMTAACGRAYELIRAERVTHPKDQVFAQHVLNARPRFNERGFTLAKSKARGRIDACIALCLALDRAEQRAEPARAPLVMSW